MKRIHVIALTLIAAWPATALAQTAPTSCTAKAWSRDKDPAGANIRSGPSQSSPVIAKLPPPVTQEGEDIAAEFSIIGSRDGWFQIRDAKQGGYDGKPPRPLFAGPGWIAGGLVGFTIASPTLVDSPTPNAKVILKLSGEHGGGAWGPDSVIVERPHACQGDFMEVSIKTPDGRKARGWVSRVCSNQVTTCG